MCNREHLEDLYEQWKTEFNYGHNKQDNPNSFEEDPLDEFANQDFFISMYREIFDYYHLPFAGNFLDVGSSMGGTIYSVEKTKQFDFLAGIDIDATAIEMGNIYKSMHHIDTVDMQVISGFSYPYEDDFFDVVFVKDVIEHLENMDNMDKLIDEVRRVTKPGGYVFIEAPNYFYPKETHLDIPKLPYYSSKAGLRATAKLYGKNVDFVQQLNFVNPFNTVKAFERKFSRCIDVHYDYRVKWKLSQRNIVTGQKKIDICLNFFRKIGLHKLVIFLLRHSRLYPGMWMIAIK